MVAIGKKPPLPENIVYGFVLWLRKWGWDDNISQIRLLGILSLTMERFSCQEIPCLQIYYNIFSHTSRILNSSSHLSYFSFPFERLWKLKSFKWREVHARENTIQLGSNRREIPWLWHLVSSLWHGELFLVQLVCIGWLLERERRIKYCIEISFRMKDFIEWRWWGILGGG